MKNLQGGPTSCSPSAELILSLELGSKVRRAVS
jgi:hypothetical protein